MSKKHTGTVKWWNDAKGFGFITPDDGTEDLFVHHSEIVTDGFATLNDGQKVSYSVRVSDRGRQAQQIEATR